ncbi:polysaccharide deacetylase family protein [Algibacter sp. 2305UL17-15]|uniref:polysaccharide deacetylase family protein n=1 Tax=Algibacter sp. 2305UL17-15 TaxID=3231268 RepID=UPI0034580264
MGIVKDVLYTVANKNFLSKFKNQNVFPYYHLVRDDQVAHIENLYKFKNCAQFLDDIDVLTRNYKAIDPKDILDDNLKNNGFLLSFDDGLQEIYTVIYPVLKKKNINAIFFINPSFVDNNEGLYKHYLSIVISHLKNDGFKNNLLKEISEIFNFTYNSVSEFKSKLLSIKYTDRHKVDAVFNLLDIDVNQYLKDYTPYITKSQIQEMIDDGFYFGGHTMTHPPLIQLSYEDQKKEIIDSLDWLKHHFGIDYSLFSFPFSDRSISKKLLNELFEYDSTIRVFGNSGLKKDIDNRIIQRFSLENPDKQTERRVVTENLYKYFNRIVGKYQIKRQ